MSSRSKRATKPNHKFNSVSEAIAAARAGETVHILCLDTETTGVTDDDRITQFSANMLRLSSTADVAALLHGNIDAVTCEAYDKFCNPGIRISDGAAEVTGITNEKVCNLPSFQKGILRDAQRLVDQADIIVGHNVGFDIKKLRHDGVSIPGDKLVEDTMFDFRDMCKFRWGIERPEKNLSAATGLFGYSFDAHNSANDVAATLFLFSCLLSLDEVCALSADGIVKKHETHSKRVQAYLRRFQRPSKDEAEGKGTKAPKATAKGSKTAKAATKAGGKAIRGASAVKPRRQRVSHRRAVAA